MTRAIGASWTRALVAACSLAVVGLDVELGVGLHVGLGRGGRAHAAEAIAAGVKIVSDKNPDASSVEAVVDSIIKPGMTDREKAEAVFQYLVRRLYHHHCPEEPSADGLEGRPHSGENTAVIDTIKRLNVYAHGLCGNQCWFQNELRNAAGLFGRIDGVSGHTAPEVKYGGRWHYLDVDMMGFVRRRDGTIPSIDEISRDRQLVFDGHPGQPDVFFKYDGPQGIWNCLKSGVRFSMYGRKLGIHSMNLTLREGESLTRWFRRQWGPRFRYYCPPWKTSGYAKRLRSKYNTSGGPSRDATFYLFKEKGIARFGSWELVYEPPLGKRSALEGVHEMKNVVHSRTGPHLRPKDPREPAEVIYKFYSPYGCAGCPSDLTDPGDDSDGCVLEGEFATGPLPSAEGKVAYSLDLGRSWKEVHSGGGRFRLDLTRELGGRYCWLVKLAFEGRGSGVSLFRSCISGQLSPASLPFVDGKTRMTFVREDTGCILFATDISESEREFKRLAHSVERFASWSESISGHVSFKGNAGGVIYKLDAPDDIVRVQAGAKFSCRKGSTRNCVSFSIDDGRTWVLACRQRVVKDEDHPEEFWGQSVEGVLDFRKRKAYSPGCTPGPGSVRSTRFAPKPVRSVLVKFHTEGGNGKLVQVYGMYVHYRRPGALPLTVTHKWEGGRHVERIGPSETEKTYTVRGGLISSNEWIKIEAASSGRRAAGRSAFGAQAGRGPD